MSVPTYHISKSVFLSFVSAGKLAPIHVNFDGSCPLLCIKLGG